MNIDLLGIEFSGEPRFAHLLRRCYEAARVSQHPSTHNAALLLSGEQVVVEGINNLPPGVSNVDARFEGPNKHVFLNHAERDAIYRAARQGIRTEGLTMVMPWLPCIPCANAVVTSGISLLITHRQMSERTKAKWQAELALGVQVLSEGGVRIIAFDGQVGADAYMHGENWAA